MTTQVQQLAAIARNAFMEVVRQPVYLLLVTATSAFQIFLATPYYFGFGDEPKMIKNSVLAVMFLSGLLGAVLASASALARELRLGTALTVLSKPVGRARFFLAKYVGVAGALGVLMYVNTVAALIAGRMAFDVYSKTDVGALLIFVVAVGVAYAVGGLSNFFLGRPFTGDTMGALVVTITVAAAVIFQFTEQMQTLGTRATVDWRMLPAGLLILFATWMFGAIALACSTRLDMIPTLALCSALFILGLMSDYLFGRRAEPVWVLDVREELLSPRWSPEQKQMLRGLLERYDTDKSGMLEPEELARVPASETAALARAGLGSAWWARVLYAVIPNWQVFWVGDLLETGGSGFPWVYVGRAMVYMICYTGAALALGVVLFEDRELK